MSLSRFGRSSGFFSRRSSALLLCSLVAPCYCLLRSAALAFFAVPHSLGWSESGPQLWKDATYDVFESRGILPVSDWS